MARLVSNRRVTSFPPRRSAASNRLSSRRPSEKPSRRWAVHSPPGPPPNKIASSGIMTPLLARRCYTVNLSPARTWRSPDDFLSLKVFRHQRPCCARVARRLRRLSAGCARRRSIFALPSTRSSRATALYEMCANIVVRLGDADNQGFARAGKPNQSGAQPARPVSELSCQRHWDSQVDSGRP